MGKWLFRADAGIQLGSGHVMRCLALAQVLQDAGETPLLVTAETFPWENLLQSGGMEIRRISAPAGSGGDLRQTIEIARGTKASWIVADGYRLDASYQKGLKEAGLKILFIDDYGHCQRYPADLVLNQNLHAHAGLYERREAYTQLLLGTRYVLLRREFRKWANWTRGFPKVARKILVTLGGSDPGNATLKVIQALKQIEFPGTEVTVVAGPTNPNLESLQHELSTARPTFRLLPYGNEMPALMAWADMAISAGGSTCWEMAFMGLPNLALVLAENQLPIATRLDEEGATVNLGWFDRLSCSQICSAVNDLAFSATERQRMSEAGRKLVDGLGALRVVKALQGE